MDEFQAGWQGVNMPEDNNRPVIFLEAAVEMASRDDYIGARLALSVGWLALGIASLEIIKPVIEMLKSRLKHESRQWR